MLDAPEPHHPDLAARLPRDAYYHLLRTLRLTLPPPLTHDPEDFARRDAAAIAAIAELAPANTAEANIAALHVAATEQWKECLRLAQQPERALLVAMQCRAQAATMMRQAQSALSLLLRTQAARQKTENDSKAGDRAAATSRHVLGLMQEALAAQPPPPPPASVPAAPAALPPPEPPPEPPPQPLSFAEQDAALEPRTAALIQRIRQNAGPPDDLLLQALITGLTPVLAELHREQHPEDYTD